MKIVLVMMMSLVSVSAMAKTVVYNCSNNWRNDVTIVVKNPLLGKSTVALEMGNYEMLKYAIGNLMASNDSRYPNYAMMYSSSGIFVSETMAIYIPADFLIENPADRGVVGYVTTTDNVLVNGNSRTDVAFDCILQK